MAPNKVNWVVGRGWPSSATSGLRRSNRTGKVSLDSEARHLGSQAGQPGARPGIGGQPGGNFQSGGAVNHLGPSGQEWIRSGEVRPKAFPVKGRPGRRVLFPAFRLHQDSPAFALAPPGRVRDKQRQDSDPEANSFPALSPVQSSFGSTARANRAPGQISSGQSSFGQSSFGQGGSATAATAPAATTAAPAATLVRTRPPAMRIGIDAHHLNGKPQGSRTYLIELIRALVPLSRRAMTSSRSTATSPKRATEQLLDVSSAESPPGFSRKTARLRPPTRYPGSRARFTD